MNSNCVPVYRDSIESEALMCRCIQSTLTFIRHVGEIIAAVTLRLEVRRNSVALGAFVVALDFHKDPSFVLILAEIYCNHI